MIKNRIKNTNKLNILPYLSKYKWQLAVYCFTIIVLSTLINLADIILMANGIEQITLGVKYGESQYYLNAIYYFLGCAGCVILFRLCSFSDLLFQNISTKLVKDLNIDISKQAFKLNSESYSNYGTGIFVQRIVSDPDSFVRNLGEIINGIGVIISRVTIIIYIATLNIFISLAILLIFLIAFTIDHFRLKEYRKNNKKLRKIGDKVNSMATEIVRSEKDIKAINLESKLFSSFEDIYEESRESTFHLHKKEEIFWFFRNGSIEFLSILVLILGVVLIDKGLLTLGAFMIVYGNKDNLYEFVWYAGNIRNYIYQCRLSVIRMSSLFDEKNFVTEHFGNVELKNVKGEIEFKNVVYTYKEYETIEEEDKKDNKKAKQDKNIDTSVQRKLISKNTIFNDLNFKIEPNTTVAFVGKSGSGKSTILNLISKMNEVSGGEVLIDGVNINDLTKQSLRSTISLVNQFPYIFDMTIRENLLLAKQDATEEEIQNAIKQAAFDDFIGGLAKGLDTKVGENGIKLSGGQKQRLAIARALLRKSSILIFDESTSSLDNFAQEKIKQSIDNLKGKSTIVIVAHRLSTIKNVDKIFFLDGGKITDSGTFNELFEKNEKFKNMFLSENI